MRPSLCLYAYNAITCVGLSVVETASSVRAGFRRCAEADDWLDKHFQPLEIGRVPNEGVSPLGENLLSQTDITRRSQRLLQLMGTTLFGGMPPLAIRPLLLLALPEHEAPQLIKASPFLQQLGQQTEEKIFETTGSCADFRGRAGGMAALAQAATHIQQNPDQLILVGGVDTFLHPVVLEQLDKANRIKSDDSPDGFTPGEGAGFILIGSPEAGRKHKLPPMAHIAMPAIGAEPGHLYSDEPYRGEGLANTLQSLFSATPPTAPIRDIYSTMNGESHWAKEWGVACNRNSAAFAAQARMHHPGENFGDIGAAFGPVLIALAAIGIAKGYRQSPALVYTSSDYGSRAATLVSSPAA